MKGIIANKIPFHFYLMDEMKGIFVCNNSQKKMGMLFSENSYGSKNTGEELGGRIGDV